MVDREGIFHIFYMYFNNLKAFSKQNYVIFYVASYVTF